LLSLNQLSEFLLILLSSQVFYRDQSAQGAWHE
jgi:hypothetical protein